MELNSILAKNVQFLVNILWTSDSIWWHRPRSTLAHVMGCCLTAPRHNLKQCSFIISKFMWHSANGIIRRRSEDNNQQNKVKICILKTHSDLQGTNELIIFSWTPAIAIHPYNHVLILVFGWAMSQYHIDKMKIQTLLRPFLHFYCKLSAIPNFLDVLSSRRWVLMPMHVWHLMDYCLQTDASCYKV